MRYVVTEISSCMECPFAEKIRGQLLCVHNEKDTRKLESSWPTDVASFCPLPLTSSLPCREDLEN